MFNDNPSANGATTGGGWGGFFESILDSGKGAAIDWWEDRLDTELALASGSDAERLATAGLAAEGAGVDEIDNAAAHTGGTSQTDMRLLYVGLGVLALVGVVIAVKS